MGKCPYLLSEKGKLQGRKKCMSINLCVLCLLVHDKIYLCLFALICVYKCIKYAFVHSGEKTRRYTSKYFKYILCIIYFYKNETKKSIFKKINHQILSLKIPNLFY